MALGIKKTGWHAYTAAVLLNFCLVSGVTAGAIFQLKKSHSSTNKWRNAICRSTVGADSSGKTLFKKQFSRTFSRCRNFCELRLHEKQLVRQYRRQLAKAATHPHGDCTYVNSSAVLVKLATKT
jgi:hypothetical protein